MEGFSLQVVGIPPQVGLDSPPKFAIIVLDCVLTQICVPGFLIDQSELEEWGANKTETTLGQTSKILACGIIVAQGT